VDVLHEFLTQNNNLAYIPFFVNGLALFAVGLTCALEARRPGEAVFSRSLWLLAEYALIVSLASWIQMVLAIQHQASPGVVSITPLAVKVISISVGSIFLFRFGIVLSSAAWPESSRWLRWLPVFLVLVWLLLLLQSYLPAPEDLANWLDGAETISRRVLYLPSLLLAGLVLFRYRPKLSAPDLARRLANASAGAALAFGLKSFVSGLVSIRAPWASGLLLGQSSYETALVFAVELLRTISTLVITYFAMKIVGCLESERRHQLELAVQQRLQAQQATLRTQLLSRESIENWSKRLEFVANAMAGATREPHRLQEVLARTLSDLLRWMGFDAGQMLLRQGDESRFVVVAQRGVAKPRSRSRCWVGVDELPRNTGSHTVVQHLDVAYGPNKWLHEQFGFQTLVTAPIRYQHEAFGLVVLCSRKSVPISANDLTLLGSLGQQIGLAVQDSRLHEQLTSAAAREERARLSREMHDSVAQDLISLHLEIAALEDMATSGDVSGAISTLHEVVEMCSEACDRVRESILGLRFAASPYGSLVSELRDYADRLTQHSSITVTVLADECDELTLSHETEVQLLGIIQEALSNIRRHSDATQSSLEIACESETVMLTIADNGRGFDTSRLAEDGQYHFGLRTMAERAESVGGSLQIDSTPGAGTRIIVKVPVLI
jgi:signal transduction histidine kinase